MTTAHVNRPRHSGCPSLAVALVLAAVVTAGCGSRETPMAPTEPSTPTTYHTISGQLVDVLTGDPAAGVSVWVNQTATASDAEGRFMVSVPETLGLGYRLSARSAAFVTRRTNVDVHSPSQVISLIPVSFNLVLFDSTLRPPVAGLARWLSTPALVVLTRELQYAGNADAAVALDTELSANTVASLVADLRDGFLTMTDGRLGDFRSVTLESPAPGAQVLLKRKGSIVVARAKDLGALSNHGGATWRVAEGRTILGAVILLERDTDSLTNSNYPSHTRKHEMGHAVGFYHATCCSVMTVGDPSYPGPTDWDRQAARIAYQRPPGNVTPDTDPEVQFAASAGRGLQWSLVEPR
jgi:hypothetical protein